MTATITQDISAHITSGFWKINWGVSGDNDFYLVASTDFKTRNGDTYYIFIHDSGKDGGFDDLMILTYADKNLKKMAKYTKDQPKPSFKEALGNVTLKSLMEVHDKIINLKNK